MDEHEPVLLVDEPAPLVRRLTLNRPNKRNALDDRLRAALFESLREADAAPDVSVVVIRGAGPSFCAGYDLSAPKVVHRAMETAGMRDGLRATTDLQALGFHQRSSRAYMKSFTERGVSAALAERDRPFGDYRGSE